MSGVVFCDDIEEQRKIVLKSFEKIADLVEEYSAKQAQHAWNVPFNVLKGWKHIDVTQARAIVEKDTPPIFFEKFARTLSFFGSADEVIVEHNTKCYILQKESELFAKVLKRISNASIQIAYQEQIHDVVYTAMDELLQRVWENAPTVKFPSVELSDWMDSQDIDEWDKTLLAFTEAACINYILEDCVLPTVFEIFYSIKPDVVGMFPVFKEVFPVNDEIIEDETIHGELWFAVYNIVKNFPQYTSLGDISASIFERAKNIGSTLISSTYPGDENALAIFSRRIEDRTYPLAYSSKTQSSRPFEGNRLGYMSATAKEIKSLASSILQRRKRTHDEVSKPEEESANVQREPTSELEARRKFIRDWKTGPRSYKSFDSYVMEETGEADVNQEKEHDEHEGIFEEYIKTPSTQQSKPSFRDSVIEEMEVADEMDRYNQVLLRAKEQLDEARAKLSSYQEISAMLGKDESTQTPKQGPSNRINL